VSGEDSDEEESSESFENAKTKKNRKCDRPSIKRKGKSDSSEAKRVIGVGAKPSKSGAKKGKGASKNAIELSSDEGQAKQPGVRRVDEIASDVRTGSGVRPTNAKLRTTRPVNTNNNNSNNGHSNFAASDLVLISGDTDDDFEEMPKFPAVAMNGSPSSNRGK
jgi:hypothetical protein